LLFSAGTTARGVTTPVASAGGGGLVEATPYLFCANDHSLPDSSDGFLLWPALLFYLHVYLESTNKQGEQTYKKKGGGWPFPNVKNTPVCGDTRAEETRGDVPKCTARKRWRSITTARKQTRKAVPSDAAKGFQK